MMTYSNATHSFFQFSSQYSKDFESFISIISIFVKQIKKSTELLLLFQAYSMFWKKSSAIDIKSSQSDDMTHFPI